MTIVKVTRTGEHIGPFEAIRVDAQNRIHLQILDNYTREKMGSDTTAYFNGAWSSVVGWGLSQRVPNPATAAAKTS